MNNFALPPIICMSLAQKKIADKVRTLSTQMAMPARPLNGLTNAVRTHHQSFTNMVPNQTKREHGSAKCVVLVKLARPHKL